MKLFTKSILPICAISLLSSFANAKEIRTNTAQMQAMDKITGRVKLIEVPVNGNIDFGTFSILVRDCQTTPPEETPENFAFIDIVDNNADGTKQNIFRGWMMSSTPALNAVEHPIYDVWLLKCIDTEINPELLLSSEQMEERNKLARLEAVNRPQIAPADLVSNLETKDQIEHFENQLTDINDQIIVKGLVPDEEAPTGEHIIYEVTLPDEHSGIDDENGFLDIEEELFTN